MKGFLFGFFLFNVIVGVGSLWIGGSAITSLAKAAKNECNFTYPVEVVFNGSWFCPKE
jgi:hypothetical protein